MIQDSDDEDGDFEDISEIPTSVDPLQQSAQSSFAGGVALGLKEDDGHSNSGRNQSSQVVSGHDLGVNFDDFLHSQSQTGQASLSPLQSRRQQQRGDQVPDISGETLGMLLKSKLL